ncbi:unnamed protein product [Candida verbasci]|uniref:Coronin n=1 Tax=Candida verbasci TaxID=1227364 RepID=A0A9W4TXL6_9ASCO|nr:unnamed protein product [Candida verbasci]
MSGKFVRASKYRHVFGHSTKKELCYENLKITKNAWDSNIIQTNGKYISVNWDSSGGGAFAIISIDEVGKAPDQVSLFRGHKGPVLDTSFNPFNKQQIASCSDDGKILIWEIPENYSFHNYVDENDEIIDITQPIKILSGHTRKVGLIEFHPCAENVLASSSLDYTVKIWNLSTGKDEITLQHKDLVTSFAFNYNGSLLATCSRDKKLRIWDIRSGKIISEGQGHTGAKQSRITWLGNTNRIITTGFSRLSDRQIGIWDIENIEKGPIDGFLVVDASSGVLVPYFDVETSILYIAGKGDGNIRYYEYENDNLYELSQYSSTDPQRGFAVAPKYSVNVKENEITKCFKTVLDNSIEPISFIVPRRSELFQSDIYPDCPSTKAALSADEWFGGKDVNGPLLISMEALFEGKESEIKESKPAVNVSEVKKQVEEKKKEEQKEKEEIKKTETKKEQSKKEETKKEESKNPGVPGKNVDDLLTSSNEVGEFLNKANEQTDEEDNNEEEEDDKSDEWEEVKKSEVKEMKPEEAKPEPKKEKPNEEPKEQKKEEVNNEEPKEASKEQKKEEVEKEEPKEESKEQKKEEVKKEEPKEEPKEQKKEEVIKEEPKEEPKEQKKEVKKEEPKSTTTTTSEPSKPKPTLVSTVEKLASLVDNLESQIQKLTNAGLEKDEKLSKLESKLEELLNK